MEEVLRPRGCTAEDSQVPKPDCASLQGLEATLHALTLASSVVSSPGFLLRSRYRRELAKAGLAPKVWPSAWSPEHSGHWAGLAPIPTFPLLYTTLARSHNVIPFPPSIPEVVCECVVACLGLNISGHLEKTEIRGQGSWCEYLEGKWQSWPGTAW